MILQIQPGFECENCIKCGQRPHIEQQKKYWAIACPNKNCKNVVKSSLVDFDTWNRLNKNTANLPGKQSLKRTA